MDAFQGREFDVVYLSTTRSSRPGSRRSNAFGFLVLPNRLNVAMSRQKRLLIAVGDAGLMTSEEGRRRASTGCVPRSDGGRRWLSAIASRLPYLLGEWPRKYRHALITPATRWRVFIEDQQQVEHDVILNTVLRIRQAGENDASRISDLLQLPDDLIRHFLATADQERLDAANSGQSIVAVRSTVGWVYRDAATGELWPQPGEQVEALDIRFSGSFRGRFDIGTAGRRTPVDALLLDARETGDLTPPRRSWQGSAGQRTRRSERR